MRKALSLALAFAFLLGAGNAMATKPVVTFIPDVIMGDGNTALGQTADGYYIFADFDTKKYIQDEDAERKYAGFTLEPGVINISMNGLSQFRASDWNLLLNSFVVGDGTGTVPGTTDADNKDILATSATPAVIRATSALWAPAGPNVVRYNGTFGPGYGWVYPGGDNPNTTQSTLVTLWVGDGAGYATGNFVLWMAPVGGTGPSFQEPMPSGSVIIDDWWPDGKGWTFVSPAFTYGPLTFKTISGANTPDWKQLVILDPAGAANETNEAAFGYWNNLSLSYGPDWIEGVIRASWTLYGSSAPKVQPGTRSRIIVGVPSDPVQLDQRLFYRTMSTELRWDTVSNLTPNNERLGNYNPVQMRHYHYIPVSVVPELANYDGLLWLAMDLIDLPASLNGGKSQIGALFIDRLIVEILPVPGAADLVNVFNRAGSAIVGTGSWSGASMQLGVLPSVGSITPNLANPAGPLMKSASAPNYTEQSIFALIQTWAIGTTMKSTENQCVRFAATIASDASISNETPANRSLAKTSMRLRASAGYGEAGCAVTIDGWEDFASTYTLAVPKVAGTNYYLFMDTPVVLENTPEWEWAFAWDVFNDYNQLNTAPPGIVKKAAWFTMTNLRMDKVLSY